MDRKKIQYKMKQIAAALFDITAKLLWPPSCVLCRRYSECTICEDCYKNCCLYRFGSRFPDEYGYNLPPVPSCSRVYAVGAYEGKLKEAVRDYKFNGELWIGEAFGMLMHEMAKRAGIYEKIDFITYVPVSHKRLNERGFDQSRLIAERVSAESGIKCVTLLERKSQGKTQSTAGRKERLMQSKDRFSFKESGACGNVLLIDDIITTGATLEECALLMKENGFDNIYGCAVATGRQDI